jgi:hypothetical protein
MSPCLKILGCDAQHRFSLFEALRGLEDAERLIAARSPTEATK